MGGIITKYIVKTEKVTLDIYKKWKCHVMIVVKNKDDPQAKGGWMKWW